MIWYISIALEMIEQYRSLSLTLELNKKALDAQNKDLQFKLTSVASWIDAVENEPLAFGAAITALHIFHARIKKAILSNEKISTVGLQQLFMAALVIALKHQDDIFNISNRSFFKDYPPEYFNIRGLDKNIFNEILIRFLNDIDHSLDGNLEYTTRVINHYCNNKEAREAMVDLMWTSSDPGIAEYTIIWLKNTDITLDNLLYNIKKAATIAHLALLLNYLGDNRPNLLSAATIEALQTRAMELAYKKPGGVKTDLSDYLAIFALASCDNKKLTDECRSIAKIVTKKSSHWEIHAITKQLREFELTTRSDWGVGESSANYRLNAALHDVADMMPNKFNVRAHLLYLITKYLEEKKKSSASIGVRDFLNFAIGSFYAVADTYPNEFEYSDQRKHLDNGNMRFNGVYLSPNQCKSEYSDFLSAHPYIDKKPSSDALNQFIVLELNSRSFQHLYRETMQNERNLTPTILKLFADRIKFSGDGDEALTMIYNTATAAQLTQIEQMLANSEFDFLKETSSAYNSNTLFKEESAWEKIQLALRVMHNLFAKQLKPLTYSR